MRKTNTGNAAAMKRLNKHLLLDALLAAETMSRTELSEQTGLAMPTVMRIVDELLEDGLVRETGKGDSSGGRKPILLEIAPQSRYFIGTDISRECHSVVIDLYGNVIGSADCTVEYQNGVEAVTEQVRGIMGEAVKNSGIDPERIVYAGVGLPGIGFKYIPSATSPFAFWPEKRREDLAQRFQIGYPTVIENMGRLGAAAELYFGYGKKWKNYIYVYADEGIGLGVVRDGRLETGSGGVGCEFGHTTINFSGQRCYCGNRGCIETYCATPALLREYMAISLEQNIPNQEEKKTLVQLKAGLEAGEAAALEAVTRGGTALGIGIGNLINLLNPQAVILGGELCRGLPLYAEIAEREARRHIFIHAARAVQFQPASVEGYTEAVGAAALAVQKYFDCYCGA